VLQCDEVLSLSTLLSTMGSFNDLVSFAKETFTHRAFFRKSNKNRALFAQKDLAIAWRVPTKGGGGRSFVDLDGVWAVGMHSISSTS